MASRVVGPKLVVSLRYTMRHESPNKSSCFDFKMDRSDLSSYYSNKALQANEVAKT